MTDTSKILEYIKDKYQKNEENCILQYGCSVCGTVFDFEELCDDHLKTCASGEHDFQSETSNYTETCTISDQSTNEPYSIPERIEDSYLESALINVDDFHESDKYLYQQNSELDKNYGITSKMISDNEIFITLPYAQGPEYSKKVIDYCDDMSIGVEKNNEQCETENEYDLSTKNVNTKSLCNMGTTGNVTNNAIKNQHKIFQKDFIKPILIPKFDAPKESVRENDVDYHENNMEDRDLSNFYELIKQSMPNNKGNDSSTRLVSVEAKNHMSRNIGQSLKQCGEHNTKFGAKGGILYSRLNAYKQEAKRKKQKQSMQKHKRKKNQKEMQILIEKTKQSMQILMKKTKQSLVKVDNTNADHDKSETHTTENGDPSQSQKTNRPMYTVINTKEEPDELSDNQDESKVFEFFDEEEEKIKKHLRKQRERKKEEKKKICCYCEKTFDNPIEVLRHKREAHKFKKLTFSREEIEPYLDRNDCTECPLCFKGLSKKGYKSVYVRHIMTHCDAYNYKCRICGQAFRRGDHCESHEKRHVVQVQK